MDTASFHFVPETGFEPARLAAPPPQGGASTNFATRAACKYNKLQNICAIIFIEKMG